MNENTTTENEPEDAEGVESSDLFDPYAVYIGGVKCDPQRIARAFRITDMGTQQALKKILRNGHKHKSSTEDKREAVTSLQRSIQLDEEDSLSNVKISQGDNQNITTK